MTNRKRSSKLQSNNDVASSQSSASHIATAAPLKRESLLPFRASTVQVIKELDQLLTMDTLIYFVQAAIELFLLSFRFAYQHPPIQKSIKQHSAQRRSVRQLPKTSPRQPVWEKALQPAVQTHPQHSGQPSYLVSPLPKSTIVATVVAAPVVVDPVTPPRATVPPPPTSDTGSVALAPRSPVPVRSQIINSGLPPPPSLPKLPPTCLLPRVTIPPSPSPSSAIFITDNKTSTSSSPSIKYPSQSFQKPPRRKPVQSNHQRNSSAKFERPPPNPPEQPSSPIVSEGRIPPHTEDRPAEDSVNEKEQSTAVNSTKPPLTRKTSAKFIRPPLPPSQPPQPDLRPIVGPSLPSQLPEQVFVEQSPNPTDTPEKSLIRKSSAKFNRPQIHVPSFKPLPQVQLSPFTFKSPIVTPAQEQHQPIEPSPQSKPTEHLPTEIRTIQPSPTESQPFESQSAQPELTKERPIELQPTEIQQLEPQDTEPQSIQGPKLEFPRSIEIRPTATESTKVQQVKEQFQVPLQLEEPVLQNAVSQPKFSLFPPRPAIAVVQTNPELRQQAQQDPNPVNESFPDLPPLILSNTRQPPPPPAIPRFPSPAKSIHRSPPSSPRISSSPGSRRSQSPVSKRNVSMAAVASNSDDFSSSTETSTRPGTSPENMSSVFPHEWDPSRDENIFSANASANVPKTIVATTSDRQFSSHGSIASSSSADSYQQESGERLSYSNLAAPHRHIRAVSTNSQYIPSPLPSPRARPHSAGSVSSGSEYVPPAFLFDNTHLRPGNAAALLSHTETLNLYRQNAKKAVDNPAIQYEFAIFMMDAARESTLDLNGVSPSQRDELLKEGLSILRRLADRGYPQAQYYLADCYSNGIGCKHNTPDLEKAFPLFVLAAKHGHVEASFRTALAYENAWGCRRDPLKAVQFLRKAASANHPGAMLRLGKACLNSEFGMPNTQPVIVEGVNWLKRAVEAATPLYPNAPYELALLHEFGYRDVVFPDEAYAVQLFAKASDLGHADAAYRLGEAYEYGRMGCPEDAGLSIHYYSQSARGGNASAMLSLCAWYMVGAEGVLEKSDEEAFAWAQRAAEGGLAKAEFATGYFLERGVGCKRDALEAWKYYVRAADHGDERAILRLRAGKDLNSDRGMIASSVTAAMESDKGSRSTMSDSNVSGGRRLSHQKAKLDSEEDAKSKDKDCVVM